MAHPLGGVANFFNEGCGFEHGGEHGIVIAHLCVPAERIGGVEVQSASTRHVAGRRGHVEMFDEVGQSALAWRVGAMSDVI